MSRNTSQGERRSAPDAAADASGARVKPLLRRPVFDVSERPFIVIWEVTRACDLACVHCRAEAVRERHPRELSTEEGKRLLEEVAEFGMPPVLFVFTGGDPVKRPDLIELVKHAKACRLAPAFSPSVTSLLTGDVIKALAEAGVKALSLSIDGAEPETHDGFRGVAGVFDRTLGVWDLARACGVKVQVNTSLAQRNLFELPKIARLLLGRDLMTWSVFFLIGVGRGRGLASVDAEQCEDVLHFLADLGELLPIKTTECPQFRRVILQRRALALRGTQAERSFRLGRTYYALREAMGPLPSVVRRRTPMDVNAARGFVFISHTGDVCPSGFLPVAAGNVRIDRVTGIYRQSPLFRELREARLLKGRCGRCEFAEVCGGSRSRAFAATGDPFAADPLCSYSPGSLAAEPFARLTVRLDSIRKPGAPPRAADNGESSSLAWHNWASKRANLRVHPDYAAGL